ncbi:thiolase family protein [Phenylobacterium sp. LH3H17]|uniref:thiolase family protein n=1 Tax=Phenylobacterium sp. LH3H17 TaxID=2903901 RepID=UPI0020C9B0AE|nr:thiolase family protein [Phenylobacterium sp. LH3H17]UTP38270.1 thiolase family protein [Phenylobacterium sp. LH3H17]
MRNVYVVGVGSTRFGRHTGVSVKQLTRSAVEEALRDAGLGVPAIQAAFFANTVQGALEGQIMVRGQMALRPLGIEGVPIFNVENACASASSALNLAVQHIRAGASDVALVVGVDKMCVPDKAAMLGVFDGAWDVHETEAGQALLMALGRGVDPPAGTAGLETRSVFMDIYASFAKAHMRNFGTTQRQIAAVSAKNHQHSALNPLAHYQASMTIEEVLAAPTVVWPLTLPMCAPVSDGAAAAVICSERVLRDLNRSRAIAVRASQVLTGVTRSADDHERHLCRIGALRAYEEAGLGPGSMDVAEVHDATAFAEIVQVENLGFCEIGQGGWMAERGVTALGGRIPVNPSGGLESKGHPIGATGLGQIHELVLQLRGQAGRRQVEGARHAIAENGGGVYGLEESTAVITILSNQL